MINVGPAWNYPQCGWMCRKQCNSNNTNNFKLMLDQVYQFTAYKNPNCYLYIGNPTEDCFSLSDPTISDPTKFQETACPSVLDKTGVYFWTVKASKITINLDKGDLGATGLIYNISSLISSSHPGVLKVDYYTVLNQNTKVGTDTFEVLNQ